MVQEPERLEADIVVVGNRRMQSAGRILGAIASAVARNAPCDIYVVKTT